MNSGKLVFYLVKKYLRFDKSQPFITISAILAFLGVSVGLMVLIIAMAIMNGTSKEFQEKISTMSYPITILPRQSKGVDRYALYALQKKFPELVLSPYLNTQAIIKEGERMEGAVVFGVDFEAEAKINHIVAEAVKEKDLSTFDMITGEGIADTFMMEPGKKVTLIFTQTQPGGFSLMPVMKRFRYKGSFKSGMQAYDNAYVYTTLKAMSKIMKVSNDKYDGIHVSCDKPMEKIKEIKAFLPPYLVAIGWWQQNGNLFSAMAMEKKALFIVLMLIILVASLNIISSLLMTVMNRRREIALLLSLGASKNEIKKAFFWLGTVIGGTGILFGTFLGLAGLYILGHFDIVTLPADVYGTSKLPLDLSPVDFASIIIGAILIVLLSAFYPSKKATEIDVLSTLRNE
ncbi:MAG: ABC transporter permease [Sulfurospirillum sp.]|nr:MAG: ABC transporter permease [Sulfurospirillum sp.]